MRYGQGAVTRITLGFPALLFYWYRLFWLAILGVNFVSCKMDSCPGRTTSMARCRSSLWEMWVRNRRVSYPAENSVDDRGNVIAGGNM